MAFNFSLSLELKLASLRQDYSLGRTFNMLRPGLFHFANRTKEDVHKAIEVPSLSPIS